VRRYAPGAQNAPSPAGAKIQVKQMFYGRCARGKRDNFTR